METKSLFTVEILTAPHNLQVIDVILSRPGYEDVWLRSFHYSNKLLSYERALESAEDYAKQVKEILK